MNDPFIHVALQVSIILGLSFAVGLYAAIGALSVIWNVVGYSYRNARIMVKRIQTKRLIEAVTKPQTGSTLPAKYQKVAFK